jgi:hypothetical protein
MSKNNSSYNLFDPSAYKKGLGDISKAQQERQFKNDLVPQNYTVTDWEKDDLVQSSFETLTDYLSEKVGMGNWLYDQATTGQTTDPAEFMRDLSARLGAPIATAKALENAPENVKESFRIMKSRWDQAEVKGGKEQLDRVLDYGADVVFSPDGLATIAGLLSGVTTFGAGTVATVGARKLAQQQAMKGLMDAVKATKAASSKNPLKSSALIGSMYGGGATHVAQELDIAADIQKDYSVGTTAQGIVGGAAIGPALVKTVGLFGKGSKLASDYFREATRPSKEISLKEARQVFDEGIEGEWIPASGKELVDEVKKLLEGPTTTVKDVTPEQVTKLVTKFSEDLGGGEKTQAEIKRIIRAAADAEDTIDGQTNKLVQGLYTVASDISGNFFGKAAGVLSPITKFSGTAAQLQKKLSHEFGIKYKTQDKIVEKDLAEVQREITGKYNERFRAIVDGLSLSEIDTKLAEEMNSALSLSLRSTKPIQHAGFDEASNKAINIAAREIKSLYKDMGTSLLDINVFKKMVDNYVPRMWKRSVVENNQDELINLFVSKAKMSKEEAAYTVESMLKIKNQVDQGTGGGYFFSSKRKIDTIGNDADFEKFLNNDVLGTLHGYTYQAGKSLAKHRVLGVNNIKEFKGFYINRIREEMEEAGQKFTPKIETQIEKLYRTATGEGMDRFGKKTQNVVDAYSFTNRVALLGMATLSSLTEVMINLGKAGVRNSVKGLNDAMKQSHKTITKDLETKLQTEHGLTAKEALSEMRSFSIHVDQALAQVGDRLAGDELVSETMQKASNKFFRLNMLDQWTKFVQSVSFSSGKHLINDNIIKLASYGSKPLDEAGQTLAGELAELGIDYKKAVDWHKAGAKTDDEFYKSDFLGGTARYTNSVVLQPTAMSGLKPMLYSNPQTAVLFQLLSYPVAFTNTVMKGAAKQIIKNPKRNAAKLAAAGTIMTGMARWTNYLRTGGDNEKNKDTDEIIYQSIARWGGNGILIDSLQRAKTAAKYSRSNLAYATLPFGPIASDSLSLIQQGIIPTVGYKVPVLSGSYFGKEIIGEDNVRHYRRSLRRKQKEVFGEFIPDFEDSSKLPGYALGGAVSALSRAAVKSVSNEFGLTKDAIKKATEGLIDSKAIEKASNQLEGDLNLTGLSVDDFDVQDFTNAIITSEIKKDYKSINELEAIPSWKNAMLSSTKDEYKKNWNEAKTVMGFDNDYKLALKTIEELQDSVDSNNEIQHVVSGALSPIKSTYNKVKINLTADDINAAAKAKFDKNSLDSTEEFLSMAIKTYEPLVSEAGASKIAKAAIIKIAANGNVNFSKFKSPKLSSAEKTSDAVVDESELNSYIKNSIVKEKVYRSIHTFKDSEFNVSFAFPREIGTHVGSKGVSQDIKLRDMLFDVYNGKDAGKMYIKFKDQKLPEKDYNAFFDMIKLKAASINANINESVLQEGYINIKKPLIYKSETKAHTWKADELLASDDATKELLNNIKSSGGEVTSKLKENIDALSKKAKKIEKLPEDTMLNKIEKDLMKYELGIDLRTEVKNSGFDSIMYMNEIEHGFKGESKYSYILFEPNQFKFTSSAKFDADDPRHAFVVGGLAAKIAPKLASGFFSKAEKEALKLNQKVGTGDVMLKRLRDKGVTKEELEWTGAENRFAGKPSVTRDELQQHFNDTKFDVDIKEGKYTDKSTYVRDEADPDLPADTFETDKDDQFWSWVETNKPHELDLIDEGDMPDFDSWYDTTRADWESSIGSSEKADFDVVPMHLTTASFEGKNTKNYRELVFTLPDQFKKASKDFTDKRHFPTLKNPILHVRLADVRPATGDSKVLLVDEIQSEAHQNSKNKESVSLPFKEEKRWAMLGLNKAMMEAAEKGYDEVAFTTGRMQALRNKQLQEVDGVERGGVKMQQFYDKTLMKLLKTNFADKYGVKITTKEFKQDDKIVKLPTIQMTTEMRNDVLTGLQMFFLGGLVESLKKKIPLSVRQLAADVVGDETKVTEKDLSKGEKEALTQAVLNAKKKNKDVIEYKDYKTHGSSKKGAQYADVGGGGSTADFMKKLADPAYSMKTTLGQARITLDDKGNTVIKDKYNFNDSDGQFKLVRFLKGMKNAGLSPYKQMRNVAKELGSPEGSGAEVEINLGKITEKDLALVKKEFDKIT